MVLKQSARKHRAVSGQRKCRLAVLRGGRIRWVERRACRLQNFARSRSHLVGIASANERVGRRSARQAGRTQSARNLSAPVAFCLAQISLRRASSNLRWKTTTCYLSPASRFHGQSPRFPRAGARSGSRLFTRARYQKTQEWASRRLEESVGRNTYARFAKF